MHSLKIFLSFICMKQDQSYFKQVFYLREDNFGLKIKRMLLWKLLVKLLHLFTENYPSNQQNWISSVDLCWSRTKTRQVYNLWSNPFGVSKQQKKAPKRSVCSQQKKQAQFANVHAMHANSELTKQVYNLFQDLWNHFLFFPKGLKN